MPNAIKYNTNAETLALKKGNFWIGTGDVGKGPSSSTGFYNGLTPTSGGYVIYSYNPSLPGNTAYFTVANDSELITYTNRIAGTSYTTANECLVYYAGQTDKVCVNIDYQPIITNGLVLNLDAGFTPSYPKTNTTWYDVSSGGNDGTLINGPTYNSANEGSIVFDGVDDILSCNGVNNDFFNSLYPNGISILTWIKLPSDFSIPNGDGRSILYRGSGGASGNWWHFSINQSNGNPVLRWWVGDGGSYNPWLHLSSTKLNVNTFYYCGLTWAPTSSTQATTKIYLNNNEIYSNVATKNVGLSQLSATIFGNYPDSNWSPQMSQYNLSVYNRALSASEITQNYNATKSRFGL